MSAQRRTALASVFAASALVAIKLLAGLLSGSLGLLAEAVHSASDLVAALLTFFAVGVAARPPDRGHPYGHGKAEHLSALGEGAVLVLASLAIAGEAIHRLLSGMHTAQASWYALAVLLVAIAIDASRWIISARTARATRSAALNANAVHFSLDLAGSVTVLVGLLLVRAGDAQADSWAALGVAILVLFSAGRVMRRNVQVLMDSASAGDAESTAREAIEGIDETVRLRRLRMHEVAGRHFADVVVGVEPDAALAHGHAVASAIEDAIARDLPDSDVVVHVEPEDGLGPLRARATAAALAVPEVREVHNVTVLRVGESTEVALHMKVHSTLSLQAAHEVADRVERAILTSVPQITSVQTHIEPLAADVATPAAKLQGPAREHAVSAIVRELTGSEPREIRLRQTRKGTLAFLTLGLGEEASLIDAHARASELERRIIAERPEIVEVVIHTEPR
jgi:cation diffusion facilitator family transporter